MPDRKAMIARAPEIKAALGCKYGILTCGDERCRYASSGPFPVCQFDDMRHDALALIEALEGQVAELTKNPYAALRHDVRRGSLPPHGEWVLAQYENGDIDMDKIKHGADTWFPVLPYRGKVICWYPLPTVVQMDADPPEED